MDTKVIFLSAVLVFMSFADAFGTYRERRSPMRELQTSLLDIINGGNVESRIWKRAIPREIRKTTKSNEAIPEPDTYLPALYDTQPNAPINSDELSEPETGPPESDPEIPHETTPIGKKTRPKHKGRNPGIKSPRNTTPKSSTVSTPKPTPSPDPNFISNSDEPEDRDTGTTPESSVPEKVPVEVKTPRPNVKSRKPTKTPNKPQKVDDNKSKDDQDDDDDEKAEKSKGNEEPDEPVEDENEPEENNEDEKEPEEDTEDEKEPEENNEEEKEPEDNNEEEEEPEDETENRPASEKPLENEDEPEEKTEDKKYPKKPTENEDEPEESKNDEPAPEEVSRRPEDEKPTRPKSPSDSKRPRRPSSTPRPPRRGTRPTKPPPPFPGDQSPTNTKKPRTESPITYIRPFKSSTTTPQPISTEDPEYTEEPADEDDNVNEEPVPSTTPKPKRRPTTRRPPKTPVTPRDNSTPPTTPNRKRKPIEQSPPADTDESVTGNNPNPDDDEYDKDPESEETPDDNSAESSDPITTTTTTAKPRTGVKERPKSPTKQRPTKRPRPPKNPPTDPTDEDLDDTNPEPNKRPDVASRFADTKPDTQSPENPDDDTPKSPSKAPNRPQNPTFNPMPGSSPDPFQNNPFFASPFGFGAANSFSSAGSSANAGASASASSSASSNAGVPAWGPWPNFVQNRFADQPMAPPPMFANNPFFRMNNPNDQQTSNSPYRPDSFNNGYDPSKNRPIRGNSSPSPSQPEPRGYTPIISISGSFDTNNPSTPSRSSFPSSDSTPGSMNDDGYGSQINFNAPSHGPMADITFDPMFGQMSNPNYGFPSGAGGYSGSSSFSSAGAGGSSVPSEIMSDNGRYPGNNDVRGFPVGSKVQMWPMQDPFSAISAQNQAMQDSIRASIQAMQQQQEQFWQQFGGGGNAQPSPGFQTYGPNMIGGGQPPQSYNPYGMQTGSQQGFPSRINYSPQEFPMTGGSFQPLDFSGFGNGDTSGSDGSAFAFGSANAGPDGANQMGMISPTGPNVESRFAENFPTSGGTSYGVFSHSESSSISGPDGKPITRKSVTTGINDNGKVHIKTVHSP